MYPAGGGAGSMPGVGAHLGALEISDLCALNNLPRNNHELTDRDELLQMTGFPALSMPMNQTGAGLNHYADFDSIQGMDMDFTMDSNPQPSPAGAGSGALGTPMGSQSMANPDALGAVTGNSATGAGAGPLPASFGMALQPNTGSTLTEFTKRRNWSQRVLEELKDFLHILTPEMRFLYLSPSSQDLLGWEPSQLVGQAAIDYIHQDDSALFIREFNESIATGRQLRFFYRFRKADGTFQIFETHGHPHLSMDPPAFGAPSANYCQGVFLLSRPYPTKNASMLDSFLEHKIENERLTKRIAELRKEEKEEQEQLERQYLQSKTGTGTPSESTTPNAAQGSRTDPETMAQYNGMPPPAKPSLSNIALTRQNLDEALARSRPDSINDKMARYEGANHLETIEMLTGLRYRDGERAQGISTGDTSPMLIRGDAGIPVSVDKDLRGSADKKKKMKVADEYVCTECGTLDSPEWRKGPHGPKTLCNACGLRWAKKEKKRQSGSTPGGSNTPGLPMQSSTGS